MKDRTLSISHFRQLAWSCTVAGDCSVLHDDRSREKGSLPEKVDKGLYLRHSLETGRKQIAGHLKQEKQTTCHQSERRGKHTGCRQTNVRKHRKGATVGIAGRAVEMNETSLCSMGEVSNRQGRKWEKAPAGNSGVKGGGMCGKFLQVNSGEDLCSSNKRNRVKTIKGVVPNRKQPKQARLTYTGPAGEEDMSEEKLRYKVGAESPGKAVQGVGDGHISEDTEDRKTSVSGGPLVWKRFRMKEVPV